MSRKIITFIPLLLLAGCKNTTDEYLTRSVCDRSEYQTSGYFQNIPVGNGVNTLMWVDTSGYVCVASHNESYRNPDYIPPAQRTK